MSVTIYKNNDCKYRLDKLEKVVYLISESAVKNIHIDGSFYVNDLTEEPLALSVYDIELKDTDTLDERYKFTHTLSFSVHGYANYKDFQGRYYAIVKTINGEYWLVNPLFPCKVTYTYTLDGQSSHTDFVLSTASNFPTMPIEDIGYPTPYECGYKHCTIDRLRLNETKYSLRISNQVSYTNDGFKDVVYDKNSGRFVEQFDGENVTHSITFNIKFDNYKNYWHYTLLEFVENRYSAIIDTSCDKHITCGFRFGLQPSFTVTANEDNTPNNIQIQLVDVHDNGDFIWYTSDIYVIYDGEKKYVYTTKYNGFECIGDGVARYLLMEEVDILGNPTGYYKALSGYESRFPNLTIVGTFLETETFMSYECADKCSAQTSFPPAFTFNNAICREYTVVSDSDWSLSSNASYITISPSNGYASTPTTVQICNTLTPTEVEVKSAIVFNYCNKVSQFEVTVVKPAECFPAGQTFDISANAQYVIVPTSCCVSAVTESTEVISNIIIQENIIRVFVPQNDDGVSRQFTLDVTLCDGEEVDVIINQDNGFERWVKENTGCSNEQKCDIERKYTGVTADDINVYTDITRMTNCVDSLDCINQYTRWVDTQDTTCNGGKKYIVQIEEKSIDGASTWFATGNKRIGEEIDDPEGDCSGETEYEEWREEGTACQGTTKYNRLRLYTSTDGTTWVATNIYKTGTRIIEIDSEDCGYSPTPVEYEKWVEDGTQCNGFDKYIKYRKYTSSDGSAWTATDITKIGEMPIEYNSEDCGYVPPIVYEYQWVITTHTQCVSTNKYYLYKKQRRVKNSSDAWEDVIPTEYSIDGGGTQPLVLAEADSEDCGYSPVIVPQYKWVNMNINTDYYCADCSSSTDKPKIEYRVSGGSITSGANCNDSSVLAASDYSNANIEYAKVGTCITSIGFQAFKGRTSLTQVLIPDSVTSIGAEALSGCTGLVDFTMPNSITSIGGNAFAGCIQLNKVNLPNSLTSLGSNAFTNCKNFNTINIPNSLTYIPNSCFSYCDGLTDIYIPSGVTSIGGYAFYTNGQIYNITIYAATPPSIGDSIVNASKIDNLKIYVPAASVETYKTAWAAYSSKIYPIQ